MTYYEENGYLEALKILLNSNIKENRNGETLSKFGISYKFRLDDGFPLLTTKKMFMKGIIAELLWFLRGETNSKILEKEKVNIWKGNSTKDFIEKQELDYEEGECGPIYGWQWRNFNGTYPKINDENDGIDQLRYVIEEVMKGTRRAVLSGWNPIQLGKMVLPPCHILYIFYTEGEELSCMMTMRSNDTFLGLPFNIASLAILTMIIGIVTGKKAKEICISVCDAHLYVEHIEQAKEQIKRKPLEKPILNIKKEIKKEMSIEEKLKWIEELKLEDFEITEYDCYDKIEAKMVV